MSDLRGTTSQMIEKYESRIAALNACVGRAERWRMEDGATMSKYRSRIAELEASVGHLTTANLRLQEVNDKLRLLSSHAAQDTFDKLRSKVAVLTTRLDKSQDRRAELEQGLRDAELALSMAEQRVVELEAEVKDLHRL